MRMRLYHAWALLAAALLVTACMAPIPQPAADTPTSPPPVQPTTPPNNTTPAAPVAATAAASPEAATPTLEVEAVPPQNQVFLPQAYAQGEGIPNSAAVARLAFIRDGDVWAVSEPFASPAQIAPLTERGDVISFAWAPDGKGMAVYTGPQICLIGDTGAAASTPSQCIDLPLPEGQAPLRYEIAWAPTGQHLALWNSEDPWAEGAPGWYVVYLDGSQQVLAMIDPVDWGLDVTAEHEPGGAVGPAVFLAGGSLVGAFTHASLCGSGGCSYQLYEFDLQDQVLLPFGGDEPPGFGLGGNLLLTADAGAIVDYGTVHSGCETYGSVVSVVGVDDQSLLSNFQLDQEFIAGMALTHDGNTAVIARGDDCGEPDPSLWSNQCGLWSGLAIYNMQAWTLASGERRDLPPGLQPALSPSSQYLAFQSCLDPVEAGRWDPSTQGPPMVYIMDFTLGPGSIVEVSPGAYPAWQPYP